MNEQSERNNKSEKSDLIESKNWDGRHGEYNPEELQKAHSKNKLDEDVLNRNRDGLRTELDDRGLASPDDNYTGEKVHFSKEKIEIERARLKEINGENFIFDNTISELEKTHSLNALAISNLGLKNDFSLLESTYFQLENELKLAGKTYGYDSEEFRNIRNSYLNIKDDYSEIKVGIERIESGVINFTNAFYIDEENKINRYTQATVSGFGENAEMIVYKPFYTSGMKASVNTIIHETVHLTRPNTIVANAEFNEVAYGNGAAERTSRANAWTFVEKYSWENDL